MSNWEHVWGYYDEYILQKRWSEKISDFEFRVVRKLLNLPRVDIVHLPSLVDLTAEQELLIEIGYTHQFGVGAIDENVRLSNPTSLDSLGQNIFYLTKAKDALTKMQHVVARTMDIWIV